MDSLRLGAGWLLNVRMGTPVALGCLLDQKLKDSFGEVVILVKAIDKLLKVKRVRRLIHSMLSMFACEIEKMFPSVKIKRRCTIVDSLGINSYQINNA